MKKLILLLLLFMASVVSGQDAFDDFNRADSTELISGNWVKPTGYGSLLILNNEITRKLGTALGGAAWTATYGRNQYVQVDFVYQTTATSIELHLHRNPSTSVLGYNAICYYNGDSIVFFQNTTRLTKITHDIVDGSVVRFSCYGDSLYLHVNNSEVAKFYETTHTSGRIGMALRGTMPRADNFTGGTYYPTFFDDIVGTPATIIQQPINDTVTHLDTAEFTVSSNGIGYQWYRNDSIIIGETNDTFKFLARTSDNNSSIYCKVLTDTIVSTDTVRLKVNGNNINKTGWPLERLSWNIDKAYPGIEYNYRLGIKGGEYPYRFALRHGPTGMTCDTITGELKWTPSGATVDSVRVTVKDLRSDSLVVQYNITATTTGFYFVDSANGNNSNAGTEAAPWLTIAYASATADSSAYTYVKKGTYTESFTMINNKCGRFFAYPGDSVIIVGTGESNAVIDMIGSNRIFQGFHIDGNNKRWIFSVAGNYNNMIWRNNEMYNLFDTNSQNPSHIFFWDQTPVYTNIVIQNNIFHDLCDTVAFHGASVTYYQVVNSLYEDNHAYDIDGDGVDEKVGGKRNTFRNNRIHDIRRYQGIRLNSNPSSDSTEICYNLIYNCKQGIQIGSNGSYIANIFVHHNTCISDIILIDYMIEYAGSTNLNIYKNIIGRGNSYPYNMGSWPDGFREKLTADSNLIYGLPDSSEIIGSSTVLANLKQWRDSGQDLNSTAIQLTLDTDSIPILSDSLAAIYGHLAEGVITEGEPANPPVITQQPVSDTVIAGQPATFFVTASGSPTYQWYRNDSLIAGATSDTFTYTTKITYTNYADSVFCQLTTDTVIYSNIVTLTVNKLSTQIDSVFLLMKQNGVTEIGSDLYRLLLPQQGYRTFAENNLDNITLEFSFQGDCPTARNVINFVNLQNGLRYADSVGFKPRITYMFTTSAAVPAWLSGGGYSDSTIKVILEEFIDSVFNKVITLHDGTDTLKNLISSMSLLNEIISSSNTATTPIQDHFWSQHIPQWWKVALEKAHSVAPNVELMWNENLVEYVDGEYKKSAFMPMFIDTMTADGSINLIDRIGFESHFFNDTNSVYSYARFKEQYNIVKSKVPNIPISITEFDLSNPKNSNQKTIDKRKAGRIAANFIKQCLDLGITQFYLWGWDSKESWINRTSYSTLWENPCWYDSLNATTQLFEKNIVYDIILDMLKSYTPPNFINNDANRILIKIDNTAIADSQPNFLYNINTHNIKSSHFWNTVLPDGSNVQITDTAGNNIPRVIDTLIASTRNGIINFNYTAVPDKPQYVYIKYGDGVTGTNDTSIYRLNDCFAKVSFKAGNVSNMAQTFLLDSIYNPTGTGLTFGYDRFGQYAHSDGTAYIGNKTNSTALQLDSGQIFLIVKYDSTNNVVNTPSFMAISDGLANAACMNQSSNFATWRYTYRNGVYISSTTTFWTRTERTLNDSLWHFSSFSWGNNRALSLNGAVATSNYDAYTGTWRIPGPATQFNIFTGRSRNVTSEMQKAYITDIVAFNKPKSVEYRSTYYNMMMDTSFFTFSSGPTIVQNPVSDTVTSGQSATFYVVTNVDGLTYQWYRNDTLLIGETNDTLTYVSRTSTTGYTDDIYCLLTTDTIISTDTVQLVANGLTISKSSDTLKLVCGNNQNVQSWQWYKNNIAISGATDSVLSIVVDSTSSSKAIYYCKITNSVSTANVGDWTVTRKSNGRTISRRNKY